MSFKSCDPGIVFELGLSESSARECLRSPPLFVCVCAGEGGGGRGFSVPQVHKLQAFFGMIIVEERKDEIRLKVE